MTYSLPDCVRTLGFGIRIVLVVALASFASAATAQRSFASPAEAAEAFTDSIARHDTAAMQTVLGSDYRKYIPSGTAAPEDITDYLAAWAASHRIVNATDSKALVEVGRNGWTLPIPIVREGNGWRFDTRAAPDELRTRRIGRNELNVIQVLLAIGDAQQEYAALQARRGTKQFAQRLLSTPGKHDGLYWATKAGEPESPLGSLAAEARPGQSYHGYHYRLLTRQGTHADGGARSYVQGGLMTGGYAVIAWPAQYGETGVMTFIAGSDGTVYQRDLGPSTTSMVRGVTEYNPGSDWTRVATK
jgi:DUF2950 family protein